jgi:agmatinase
MNNIIKNSELENLFHPRFMEFRCDYKAAKYVFNPFLFEREDAFIKGALKGPSAILKASHFIEKYNIPTDSKCYLSGFFTLEPTIAVSEENLIEIVNKTVTIQISEGKIPVNLFADGSGSIGVFYGLSKIKKDVTILSLDAHLSLRETMGGTRNHRMTKMHHAKVCFENVLHFGVSSMGNCEKHKFDADKIFFAEDILEDKYWLEDVLIELKEDVYITIDMSVFDPNLINSQDPDVSGITYKHIEKLLRAVIKEKNVIGIDICGFVPKEDTKAGEIIIAKMIYDILSHIDARG